MNITLNYTTQVKAALGFATDSVEVESGCTVSQLLSAVAEKHGDTFRELVLTDDGQLLPSIVLCLGDAQVGFDAPNELVEGDEITILSAISGG